MIVLLIGCGRHAINNIIPALNKTGIVKLLYVCDPLDSAANNAISISRQHTIRVTDFRSVLNRCDRVIVAVSPSVNRSVIQACRDLAVPVLVEKPPAISSLDWQRTLDKNPHSEIYVGLNYRFSPALRAFRVLADPGRLPYTDIRYFSRRPFGAENGLSPLRTWVIGNLIHICATIIEMFQYPLEIRGYCSEESQNQVFLCVALLHSEGRIVNLSAGNITPQFDISIVGHSMSGETIAMNGCKTVKKITCKSADPMQGVTETLLYHSDAAPYVARGHFDEFVSLCGNAKTRSQIASAKDGLDALRLCEQILDACLRKAKT